MAIRTPAAIQAAYEKHIEKLPKEKRTGNWLVDSLAVDEYACPNCGEMKYPIFSCYACYVRKEEKINDQAR